MKTRLLIIFVIGIIGFSANPALAIPPMESEFIYEFSDIIATGKVISVDDDFSPDYNLYRIEVENFVKNPNHSNIILAAGPNTTNLRIGNHVFEMGERGLFFLQKDTSARDQNTFKIHYESAPIKPEWDTCNIFEHTIPKEHWVLGGIGPKMKMYQTDDFRTESFETGKQIIITQDIFNHTPNTQEILVGMTISNQDDPDSLYIFSETASHTLEPCTVYHTINWTFTPNEPGHYSAELYNMKGSRYTMTVNVDEPSSESTPVSVTPSPLWQTNIGIEPHNIVCKQGLGLVLKPSEYDLPACVKSESVQKLQERGWSVFVSSGIVER